MAERVSAGSKGLRGTEEIKSSPPTLAESRTEAIREARDAVRNAVDTQKGKMALRLGCVAKALRAAAKDLDQEDVTVGRYADLAANQVNRVSEALNERKVEDLIADAEEFARRQPLFFVGAALSAGFLVARMIKSGDDLRLGQPGERFAGEIRKPVEEAATAVEGGPASRGAAPDAGPPGAFPAGTIVGGESPAGGLR
jgi:hypothetical protein